MAKLAARNLNLSVSSVAIEDELSSAELSIEQETPIVTGFSDAGPRRVVGGYDYGLSGEGHFDGAASQGDATLFALVGVATVQATAFDPTGNAAGANDPNYDSTDMLLESYSIRAARGGSVEYSFQLRGNAALTRAVA